jgi:solute carrier family 12 (potassium/chloride transporters), member 9
MDVQSYVMVLEDMILKLQTNVAVAVGFNDLELPDPKNGNTKKYIDLWPIQMSAEIVAEEGGAHNVLTTNFDTYTLILQLGCILNTVPSWRKSYKLRVAVFVEYESDVEDERQRVCTLLENLRIEAEVLVFWLAAGDIKSYQVVVNGKDPEDAEAESQIEKVLEDEDWWHNLQKIRGKVKSGDISAVEALSVAEEIDWPSSSFQNNRKDSTAIRLESLRKLLKRPGSRSSFGNLSSLGVSLGMRTHRLDDDLMSRHASHASASEESASDEESFSNDSAEDDSDDMDIYMSLTASEGIGKPTSPLGSPGRSGKKLSSKKSSISSKRSKASSRKGQDDLSRSRIEDLDMASPLIDFEVQERDDDENRHRSGARENPSDVSATGSPFPSNYLDVKSHQSRRASSPHFSSSPVPRTQIASEEGVGPSIMFANEPHPRRQQKPHQDIVERTFADNNNGRSIYTRKPGDSGSPPKPIASASGFPAAASVPLSFNDLPCRAQHLILNELITLHSEDTAVIFTTLPAPVEGTYKSESDSLGYVSDLEVLCGGLPPTLMVHSNSMTVTMNL